MAIVARLVRLDDGEELCLISLERLGPGIGEPTGYRGTTTYTDADREWIADVRIRRVEPRTRQRPARTLEG